MREVGVLVGGLFAAIAGVVGIFWLGLTGLVWHEGQLKGTTSYDASELGVGTGALAIFWGVAGVLLLLAVYLALRQARLEPERKAYFHRLAWLIPLGVVLLVGVAWPLVLAPGGANFAP